MGRFLLILLASLVALAATATGGLAADVNPVTGEPYARSKEAREYLEQARADEQAAIDAANEQLEQESARRREKAAEIQAHDAEVNRWLQTNPPPAGTAETSVGTYYDEDYTPTGTHITYMNEEGIYTHEVELGPDAKPTGPIRQTQQGKVWETIGPRIPPDGTTGIDFGRDADGNITIEQVTIHDSRGREVGRYDFNQDGVPWRGETFDAETGQRTGGFLDERLKPPERTVGGALDVPAQLRLITGPCEKCRPLVERANELAHEINRRIVEMQRLSEEHQHAFPEAQKPIRMRYDVLKGQIDELMPQYEAARAEALDCEKICRPQASLPDGVVRPPLAPVNLTVPASFCSQTARVEFLNTVYNPAAAAALANSQAAQAYAARLNGLFTEYMRNEGGPIWAAIQKEMAEYKPIAEAAFAESNRVNGLYDAIMAVPVADCPQLAENAEVPSTGQPVKDQPAKPGKPDCPPEERRRPIKVGPNGKVGSGARLKAKAASTALGIAGGLLGSAAGLPGGGGGGGGSGPPTVVCKIKDGEMTVFNDPTTGVSLKVGAKRAGNTVVVFADIARSPDNGTFQTAFLENPQGEVAPADVDICDLWGEWKLTVSWTKSTYVDGQLVSQESGGWSKMGRFVIPGTLSSVDKPDGLWKRLGFSNASHGARKIAMQYKLPAGGGPVDLIVHITRPGEDPVTTVPFALTMVEGPGGGFTFTKAPDKDCPPTLVNVGNTPQTTTPPPASNPPPVQTAQPPPAGTTVRAEQKVENLAAFENWIDEERADDLEWRDELDALRRCDDLVAWGSWNSKRATWLRRLRERVEALNGVVPTGPLADGVREATTAERARTEALIKEIEAMKWDCPMPPPPPDEPSVVDEIDHVPVIS